MTRACDRMPNRYVKDRARRSPSLDRLSDGAERLFWRLLLAADDYGRFEADPRVLLAECYPRRIEEIKSTTIAKYYAELEAGPDPIVLTYQVRGRRYGVFRKWDEKARAKRSKCPPPPPDPWGESLPLAPGEGYAGPEAYLPAARPEPTPAPPARPRLLAHAEHMPADAQHMPADARTDDEPSEGPSEAETAQVPETAEAAQQMPAFAEQMHADAQHMPADAPHVRAYAAVTGYRLPVTDTGTEEDGSERAATARRAAPSTSDPPPDGEGGGDAIDPDLLAVLRECPELQMLATPASAKFWDGVLHACEQYPAADDRWLTAKLRQWDHWFRTHPERRSHKRQFLEARLMRWLTRDLERLALQRSG